MDKYVEKESYISSYTDPITWRCHSNYFILKYYQKYIKGLVADCGSNHCAVSILLNDFNPNKIVCIDLNKEALQIGANTAASMGVRNMNFVHSNLLDISCNTGIFDFIVSFHTLEHIYPEDAHKIIQEMHRILKPGGYLLISIPYEDNYPDPCHVAFYNEKSLSDLMSACDFVVMEVYKDDRFNQKNLLTGLFYKKNNIFSLK
jgi:SAM-dependent methyltransferase